MTLRTATLKGQPRRNFKRVSDSDAALTERVELVSSARKHVWKTPAFMPTDPEGIRDLGEELITWANESDSTTIDDFFLKKCMSPLRFYRAAHENQYLADCLDIALASVGHRLHDKVKDHQMYVMSNVKQYSSLGREAEQRKIDAEANNRTITTFVEEKIGIPVFTTKKS